MATNHPSPGPTNAPDGGTGSLPWERESYLVGSAPGLLAEVRRPSAQAPDWHPIRALRPEDRCWLACASCGHTPPQPGPLEDYIYDGWSIPAGTLTFDPRDGSVECVEAPDELLCDECAALDASDVRVWPRGNKAERAPGMDTFVAPATVLGGDGHLEAKDLASGLVTAENDRDALAGALTDAIAALDAAAGAAGWVVSSDELDRWRALACS